MTLFLIVLLENFVAANITNEINTKTIPITIEKSSFMQSGSMLHASYTPVQVKYKNLPIMAIPANKVNIDGKYKISEGICLNTIWIKNTTTKNIIKPNRK